MTIKYTVVIPVYGNEPSIFSLFDSLEELNNQLDGNLQVVFVDDGSPDFANLQITKRSEYSKLQVMLVRHSRNFGSFSAIRTGFRFATGDLIAVISADLQEPPDLLLSFFRKLINESIDIVFGSRISRHDPANSRSFSRVYWTLYRKLINNEIPKNGVDVFACRRSVVNVINQLNETNTSLIGMLFWIGFKKDFLQYERLERVYGKSAWTVRKKFRYMSDSIFAFSDFPIRIIRTLGVAGSLISVSLGIFLLAASLMGKIEVPGYAPTMLAILFGNSAMLTALGILGSYLWRTFENSQGRPFAITYSNDEED